MKQCPYSETFFEEETKCEYTITKEQKKIWAVQLDLLYQLLEVCKKYNIKVYAFAGTLLGAVRHHGFIPWDDDVDVCMLREDYEKLISIGPNEFKDPYFFQTAFTDKRFHIGYARLRNSNTTGFIPYNDDIHYNNGIFIDIFILNGYTEHRARLKMQITKLRFIEKLIHSYYVDLSQKNGIEKQIMRLVKSFDNRFLKYETLLQWYYKTQTRYDYESERVAILTSSDWIMERYWCRKKDLGDPVFLPFESVSIPVPGNYENILKNAYGNYMELPPVEKRGKWHENIIYFDPDMPYTEYVSRLHGKGI